MVPNRNLTKSGAFVLTIHEKYWKFVLRNVIIYIRDKDLKAISYGLSLK